MGDYLGAYFSKTLDQDRNGLLGNVFEIIHRFLL